MGEICKVAKSGGNSENQQINYIMMEKYHVLAISDLTKQGHTYLTYTTKKISKLGLENSSAWIVPVNTIIYSMYASVGFVSIAKIHLATSPPDY